jgi:hypothetical protein
MKGGRQASPAPLFLAACTPLPKEKRGLASGVGERLLGTSHPAAYTALRRLLAFG